MKTFVLVAGLIAMVPQVDSQGKIVAITALMLNAEGKALGQEVHPHEPLIGVYDHNTVQRPRSATLQAGAGWIVIDDPDERIMDFDRLFPKGGWWLRKDCLTGDVQKECLRADGKPALVGRVTLTGSWIARPVDLDHMFNPRPDVVDHTTLGFVSYSPPRISTVEYAVAGALLFETTESVKLVVDAKDIPVLPVNKCADFHLGQDPCALIAVRNMPKSGGMPGPGCGQRRGEVDAHFDLMYEILDAMPDHRYVPFNQKEDVEACRILLAPGPGDNPPRIKCPTTRMPPVAKP